MSPVMSGPARYLVGLIGAGIGTSLSPRLHEREADQQGLRYFYQLMDIDELGLRAADVGLLLAQACGTGFRGLNITHPCKQVVVRHLDGLSPVAAALDAVNTVVFDGARMVGHNTDSPGFEAALARGLPGAALRHVVVLGAGGAGAAVAHAILQRGAGRLTIVDLLPARAQQLTAALRRGFGPDRSRAADPGDLAAALADADGLVNATPVGMESRTGTPVPAELLRPELWVADIVYRPAETELLRQARAVGCPTLPGDGMLVFQAAASFRLFTGREPDIGRMFRHLASLTDHRSADHLPGAGRPEPDHGRGSHVAP